MELTGKAKEDFDNWWSSITSPALSGEIHHFKVKTRFDVGVEDLTDSMKYGVYVDWFDSVGIIIEVIFPFSSWSYIVNDDLDPLKEFDTRQEVRIKAIEKANEIYNNQ